MRRVFAGKRNCLALRDGTRGRELSEIRREARSALGTRLEELDGARAGEHLAQALRDAVGVERAAVLLGGGAQLFLLFDGQRVEHAARDRQSLRDRALLQRLELR